MSRLLCLSLLALLVSCAGPRVRIFHYNIKELSSEKILSDDPQFAAVREILALRDFDILSVNEIQYDLPGVPKAKFKTTGENLRLFARKMNRGLEDWNQSFHVANTGQNAKRLKNGNYPDDPSLASHRALADQVNFGVFPAQYSTGMLTRYKIKSELVIRELEWKSFNPKIRLEEFRAGDGRALPQDMALFDKNFSDVTLEVEGQELHVILLHAVPSYHFGNPKSPNYERNRDQLRFLEWYVTGSTDVEIALTEVKPLKEGTNYIIVGDLNASYHDPKSLGGEVLRRLAKKTKMWMTKPQYTNEGGGYSNEPFRLMLDYLFVSPNIKVKQGVILYSSAPRRQLGCEELKESVAVDESQVLVSYSVKGQTCHAIVTELDHQLKVASDHFPIWAELELP